MKSASKYVHSDIPQPSDNRKTPQDEKEQKQVDLCSNGSDNHKRQETTESCIHKWKGRNPNTKGVGQELQQSSDDIEIISVETIDTTDQPNSKTRGKVANSGEPWDNIFERMCLKDGLRKQPCRSVARQEIRIQEKYGKQVRAKENSFGDNSKITKSTKYSQSISVPHTEKKDGPQSPYKVIIMDEKKIEDESVFAITISDDDSSTERQEDSGESSTKNEGPLFDVTTEGGYPTKYDLIKLRRSSKQKDVSEKSRSPNIKIKKSNGEVYLLGTETDDGEEGDTDNEVDTSDTDKTEIYGVDTTDDEDTEGGDIECPKCTSRFKDVSELKTHMLSHFMEKSYQCKICMKAFQNNAGLKRHFVIHEKKETWKCRKCKSGFSSQEKLQLHMTKAHQAFKRYRCNECKERFGTKDQREAHVTACKYTKDNLEKNTPAAARSMHVSELSGTEISEPNKKVATHKRLSGKKESLATQVEDQHNPCSTSTRNFSEVPSTKIDVGSQKCTTRISPKNIKTNVSVNHTQGTKFGNCEVRVKNKTLQQQNPNRKEFRDVDANGSVLSKPPPAKKPAVCEIGRISDTNQSVDSQSNLKQPSVFLQNSYKEVTSNSNGSRDDKFSTIKTADPKTRPCNSAEQSAHRLSNENSKSSSNLLSNTYQIPTRVNSSQSQKSRGKDSESKQCRLQFTTADIKEAGSGNGTNLNNGSLDNKNRKKNNAEKTLPSNNEPTTVLEKKPKDPVSLSKQNVFYRDRNPERKTCHSDASEKSTSTISAKSTKVSTNRDKTSLKSEQSRVVKTKLITSASQNANPKETVLQSKNVTDLKSTRLTSDEKQMKKNETRNNDTGHTGTKRKKSGELGARKDVSKEKAKLASGVKPSNEKKEALNTEKIVEKQDIKVGPTAESTKNRSKSESNNHLKSTNTKDKHTVATNHLSERPTKVVKTCRDDIKSISISDTSEKLETTSNDATELKTVNETKSRWPASLCSVPIKKRFRDNILSFEIVHANNNVTIVPEIRDKSKIKTPGNADMTCHKHSKGTLTCELTEKLQNNVVPSVVKAAVTNSTKDMKEKSKNNMEAKTMLEPVDEGKGKVQMKPEIRVNKSKINGTGTTTIDAEKKTKVDFKADTIEVKPKHLGKSGPNSIDKTKSEIVKAIYMETSLDTGTKDIKENSENNMAAKSMLEPVDEWNAKVQTKPEIRVTKSKSNETGTTTFDAEEETTVGFKVKLIEVKSKQIEKSGPNCIDQTKSKIVEAIRMETSLKTDKPSSADVLQTSATKDIANDPDVSEVKEKINEGSKVTAKQSTEENKTPSEITKIFPNAEKRNIIETDATGETTQVQPSETVNAQGWVKVISESSEKTNVIHVEIKDTSKNVTTNKTNNSVKHRKLTQLSERVERSVRSTSSDHVEDQNLDENKGHLLKVSDATHSKHHPHIEENIITPTFHTESLEENTVTFTPKDVNKEDKPLVAGDAKHSESITDSISHTAVSIKQDVLISDNIYNAEDQPLSDEVQKQDDGEVKDTKESTLEVNDDYESNLGEIEPTTFNKDMKTVIDVQREENNTNTTRPPQKLCFEGGQQCSSDLVTKEGPSKTVSMIKEEKMRTDEITETKTTETKTDHQFSVIDLNNNKLVDVIKQLLEKVETEDKEEIEKILAKQGLKSERSKTKEEKKDSRAEDTIKTKTKEEGRKGKIQDNDVDYRRRNNSSERDLHRRRSGGRSRSRERHSHRSRSRDRYLNNHSDRRHSTHKDRYRSRSPIERHRHRSHLSHRDPRRSRTRSPERNHRSQGHRRSNSPTYIKYLQKQHRDHRYQYRSSHQDMKNMKPSFRRHSHSRERSVSPRRNSRSKDLRPLSGDNAGPRHGSTDNDRYDRYRSNTSRSSRSTERSRSYTSRSSQSRDRSSSVCSNQSSGRQTRRVSSGIDDGGHKQKLSKESLSREGVTKYSCNITSNETATKLDPQIAPAQKDTLSKDEVRSGIASSNESCKTPIMEIVQKPGKNSSVQTLRIGGLDPCAEQNSSPQDKVTQSNDTNTNFKVHDEISSKHKEAVELGSLEPISRTKTTPHQTLLVDNTTPSLETEKENNDDILQLAETKMREWTRTWYKKRNAKKVEANAIQHDSDTNVNDKEGKDVRNVNHSPNYTNSGQNDNTDISLNDSSSQKNIGTEITKDSPKLDKDKEISFETQINAGERPDKISKIKGKNPADLFPIQNTESLEKETKHLGSTNECVHWKGKPQATATESTGLFKNTKSVSRALYPDFKVTIQNNAQFISVMESPASPEPEQKSSKEIPLPTSTRSTENDNQESLTNKRISSIPLGKEIDEKPSVALLKRNPKVDLRKEKLVNNSSTTLENNQRSQINAPDTKEKSSGMQLNREIKPVVRPNSMRVPKQPSANPIERFNNTLQQLHDTLLKQLKKTKVVKKEEESKVKNVTKRPTQSSDPIKNRSEGGINNYNSVTGREKTTERKNVTGVPPTETANVADPRLKMPCHKNSPTEVAQNVLSSENIKKEIMTSSDIQKEKPPLATIYDKVEATCKIDLAIIKEVHPKESKEDDSPCIKKGNECQTNDENKSKVLPKGRLNYSSDKTKLRNEIRRGSKIPKPVDTKNQRFVGERRGQKRSVSETSVSSVFLRGEDKGEVPRGSEMAKVKKITAGESIYLASEVMKERGASADSNRCWTKNPIHNRSRSDGDVISDSKSKNSNTDQGCRCPECNVYIPDSTTLHVHRVVAHGHGDKKVYECQTCHKKFRYHEELQIHEKTEHFPYECLDCNDTFTSPGRLSLHRSRRHYKHMQGENLDSGKHFKDHLPNRGRHSLTRSSAFASTRSQGHQGFYKATNPFRRKNIHFGGIRKGFNEKWTPSRTRNYQSYSRSKERIHLDLHHFRRHRSKTPRAAIIHK